MADLSTLTSEVQENSDVIASAVSLINGIAAQLAAAATDPAAIAALADQLNTSANELAAAVAANTPAAAPAPAPTPDPAPADPTPADPAPVDPAV